MSYRERVFHPGAASRGMEVYGYTLTRDEKTEIVEYRRSFGLGREQDSLFEIVSPDGIHFWYWNYYPGSEKVIRLRNSTPFIQLNFSLSSHSRYKTGEEQAAFAILDSHEYNVFYYPAGDLLTEWENMEMGENFGLNLLPEMLQQYLPGDHPWHQKLTEEGASDQPFPLSDINLPLIPRIKAILYEMLHCPLSNHYKRLYLRAKTVELLLMVFSHSEAFIPAQKGESPLVRDTDVQKMQQAREILHENFQNPCSLIDLAHQVGTNENYLKKHFKQVFGKTVFGYVQELRMQQAKMLLMKEEYDIAAVAKMIGYKHPHHFVAAFKKYFGYAPLKLRGWLLFLSADWSWAGLEAAPLFL